MFSQILKHKENKQLSKDTPKHLLKWNHFFTKLFLEDLFLLYIITYNNKF